MATRKPDWAQRAVQRNHVVDTGHGCYIHVADATKLLRAYHRKVKRMVQEVIREHRKVMALIVNDRWVDRLPVEGGIEACGDILDKLKELEQ